MRVVGGKHRVHAGQVGERRNTARGVALQNQPPREFGARFQGGVLESMPAARSPGIVAADERQPLAALRNEMPRDGDACSVIVEPGISRLRAAPKGSRCTIYSWSTLKTQKTTRIELPWDLAFADEIIE